MTALPAVVSTQQTENVRVDPQDSEASIQANQWLTRHHAELASRARVSFRWSMPQRREEAVAEVLAMAAMAVHRAAQRGVLARLTPYYCVFFATRQFRCGRRVAGMNSTDVMSEAAQIRHGIRVVSLDESADVEADHRPLHLGETLADGDAEDPAEIVRREHDYRLMLQSERVSAKAHATFRFLAETAAAGRLSELAAELKVSPARITQLKDELAAALGNHGYTGPLGPRPRKHS